MRAAAQYTLRRVERVAEIKRRNRFKNCLQWIRLVLSGITNEAVAALVALKQRNCLETILAFSLFDDVGSPTGRAWRKLDCGGRQEHVLGVERFWVLSGLEFGGGDERWRKSARSWHRRRAKRRVCTLFSERLSPVLVLTRRRMMSTHTGWTNYIAHGAETA